MQAQTPGGAHRFGLADSARFLKSLVAAPRLTGAVAPSGRALARAMAAAAGPPPRGLIVELGPGTGPVTRSLIETGVARERLALIEYDPGFCRLLRERFAPAMIIQGDAYDLPRTLAELAGQPIGAVVSSLPLLNQPPDRRRVRADGPVRPVRSVHLWSPVAHSARGLRQSLCRGSVAADPAQSAACPGVDLPARGPCGRGSVN